MRQAGGCTKPKKCWGGGGYPHIATCHTQRDISNLLGMMKMFHRSMTKWGEARKEGYRPGGTGHPRGIQGNQKGNTKNKH